MTKKFNLQAKFFEEYGRFPAEGELKSSFRTLEESRKMRNTVKFEEDDYFLSDKDILSIQESLKDLEENGSVSVPNFNTAEEFYEWIKEEEKQ